MSNHTEIQRAIRKTAAPSYLGMKRGMFERHIRPLLNEVTIGGGKFYDRLEMDTCFENFKRQKAKQSQPN